MGNGIRLFGGFSIQVNDVELSGLNSRNQALLAYLAIHHPKSIPRPELAFTLWADSNEEQALTNLRKALHRIKQNYSDGEIIQTDARTIRLHPDTRLDITDFAAALDSAGHAHRANDPASEQTALETAAAFYKGDLLPGFYDDWLTPERGRLRDTFIRSMDRLIALLEARKHYRDAIQHAQRLLQTDNLREETYRTQIRLHSLNNNRAAALHVYHICAETLSKELGVEPDLSTRELYERLLKSETRLSRKTPARPMSTPLVAREAEWKSLLAEWKKASSGELRTVVLSGEAGIGKTRLAEELLHWASRQGIRTAFAACYSAERQISFAPVIEWLHGFSFENLGTEQRSELSRLLPELRSESTTSQPMTENWQRQVFFESMARALLAGNEPLVLLLDDIQWCDSDTLGWLRFFLHFDKHARVLLLLTLRSEELPANHELQLLLVDLRAEGRLTEMELNRFDEKQTGELGSHLLGRNFSEAEAAALFLESEGVPLFVVEMANAGVRLESDRVVEAGTGARDAGLPPRLQAVLEGRLARLSSPARAVIESAAVIGREFGFGLLRKVSELDEGVTINALDELWRSRMIRERGGDYDFSHDKLREATLTSISPIRLRWLHQRTGEALEMDQGNLECPRIAEHFERAGLQKKALEYYARAAEQAEQIFAFNKALEQLRHAILLETKHDSLANLHEQRGDLLKMVERREDAFQAYAQAHSLSEDDLQKARVSRNQSTLVGRFNLDVARQKYQATLDDLRRAQSKPGYWLEWIEAQLAWIEICYWTQNGKEVSELLEQIREPIEQHGTVLQKLTYRARLISSAFINERYRMDQSHLSLAQETIELAIESGIPHQVSSAKRQFAMVALCANQLEVAEAAFREVISLCKQNGDMNSMLIARTYLSLTHRRQRKLQEVIADTGLLEQKLEQTSHNPAYRGVVQTNRAWLAYQADELENARQLAQSALATWRKLDNPYPLHSLALFLLFAIAVHEENTDQAFACARAMLAPPQWKLTLEVESALLAALEVDPADNDLSLRLCREAVEKAKQAGYL